MELLFSTLERDEMLELLSRENIDTIVIPKDQLRKFSMLPLKDKGEILDKYCLKFFHDSEYFSTGLIPLYCISTKCFRDTIDLPFENITLPCPIDYETYLNEVYGNWHEYVIQDSHINLCSPDISYKTFLEQRDENLN